MLLKDYKTQSEFNSVEVGLGLHRHIQEIKKRKRESGADRHGNTNRGMYIERNNRKVIKTETT